MPTDDPLPKPCGSLGEVALPQMADSTGRARPPDEPNAPDPTDGSAGEVALPKIALPKRKKLPHKIPSWVHQGERNFITINCKTRGSNELIKHAQQLLKSAEYYDHIGRWYLWLMVIMPDHIHFIATFDLTAGLRNTVSSWKRYQTTSLGIDWQSDFFEHRLRSQAEFDEKCHYVRMNPVRKGLIKNPDDWPYVMDRRSLNSP